jgi:hypothetical protein
MEAQMTGETPREFSRIFISYRREDSIAHVNGLFSLLRNRFGDDKVFKDTADISAGHDFVHAIQFQLALCSILLAVIGNQWLTAQSRNSTRRLDDPDDWLRVEIATALRDREVRVIPVLVGGAAMPSEEALPSDLVDLCRRQAFELRDHCWESDVNDLMKVIETAVSHAKMIDDTARSVRTPELEDLIGKNLRT